MPNMERLWAPWRMPYIRRAARIKRCIFCAARARRRDPDGLILHRGATCFCLLNKYPYNTGHLLVAPYAHKRTLARLTDAERLELISLTARMQELLDRRLAPHGYNLGMNLGRTAGAGVPGHLHLHIVPRWNGDTNFMPATTGVKVLPMGLEELYRRLTRPASKRTGKR
jgi:ATP adenylyltransferase